MAGSTFGEFCLYLEFPSDFYGFRGCIQFKFARLLLNGNFYRGLFSIGRSDGNFGGTGLFGADFASCAYGDIFVGGSVAESLIRSIFREDRGFQTESFSYAKGQVLHIYFDIRNDAVPADGSRILTVLRVVCVGIGDNRPSVFRTGRTAGTGGTASIFRF